MGRLKGSYTVEAAVVMAVVLFAILGLMKEAFRVHDQVRGAMVLGETVERCRRLEDESGVEKEIQDAKRKVKPLLYFRQYQITVSYRAGKVEGEAGMEDWSKSISMDTYRPEEFLRLLEAAGV